MCGVDYGSSYRMGSSRSRRLKTASQLAIETAFYSVCADENNGVCIVKPLQRGGQTVRMLYRSAKVYVYYVTLIVFTS